MAQIKIGFGTIVGHEHFAVLKRTHGPRVHIDVGIQLKQGYFEASRLK